MHFIDHEEEVLVRDFATVCDDRLYGLLDILRQAVNRKTHYSGNTMPQRQLRFQVLSCTACAAEVRVATVPQYIPNRSDDVLPKIEVTFESYCLETNLNEAISVLTEALNGYMVIQRNEGKPVKIDFNILSPQ